MAQNIPGGVAHKLPLDIKKTLEGDKQALIAWEKLTPLARNEWICWTISVKREETRKEHIQRLKSELKEGIKRPCCWYGCIHRTDKAISPSIQNIIVNKKSKTKKR